MKPSLNERPREGGARAEQLLSKIGCSFDADTPVLMADGEAKPIKAVEDGDVVTATDPQTGRTVSEPVTRLHDNLDTDLADLTVTDGHGKSAILHTTQNHPFWDVTTRRWTRVDQLKVGDQLKSTDRVVLRVLAVRRFTQQQHMYNLTVADIHTYYVLAGDTPVLVHNAPANCVASNLKGALTDGRFGDILRKWYPINEVHAQFQIHTPYGARFVDYAVEDGNGGYRLFEVKANGSRYTKIQRAKDEPFSSCIAVGLDVVQDEDGLHDRGRAAWAAAQFGEDLPGFERGDCSFAASTDLRVGAVDGLLPD